MEDYAPEAVPLLARGMKFRHDPVRDAWVVLGPERAFLPDEHATAVLRLVDGVRTVGRIVDHLVAYYDAPPGVIAADVWDMLLDLSGRGVVRITHAADQ